MFATAYSPPTNSLHRMVRVPLTAVSRQHAPPRRTSLVISIYHSDPCDMVCRRLSMLHSGMSDICNSSHAANNYI